MRFPRAAQGSAAAVGLALVTSIVLALVWGWNRILSGSADLTYHLQVLDVVRPGGLVPASSEAFMGEMYGYPDLGHRIAAALTHLGLGDLNALVLVGCFCAALTWFCLLDHARRVGLWALAGAAVLSLLNAWTTRASFGAEIVGNFFFSQMAGEAFAVAALVAGQPILARSTRAYVVYAVVAALAAGCFHLIPALHFALGAAALLGVEGLRLLLAERRLDRSAAAGIVLVIAAIVLNPYFASMRRVSTNDGVVGYGVEFSVSQLAVLELGLVAFSAWILLDLAFRKEPLTRADRAAGLLAALGAAAGAAALAQIVSFVMLGESSTYAVKKHAFGILTMLCFVAPAWVVRIARASRPAPGWAPLLVVAGQALGMTLLFARPSVLDVGLVDDLIADTRDLRLARGQEKTDILFAAAQVRPLVSYVLSSAALRRRRDEAAMEVLHTGYPLHLERVARIATPEGDLFDKPECREGPPLHGLVVVRGPCAALPVISFKAGGAGAAYLREGWSGPEAGGTWSVGPRAVAEIPLSGSVQALQSQRLEVAAFGYLPAKSPSRRVTVSVAGGGSETFTFTGQTGSHAFVLPLSPAAVAGGKVRVVFDIANPISPAEAGQGEDRRRLGVGLEQVRLLPTVVAEEAKGWRRREEP